jgi:hypothetical protein
MTVARALASALLASALLAGAPIVSAASAAPGASGASGDQPAANPQIGYARIERACPLPAPGEQQCFALRRVPVPAGTAGAKPFVVNDGATESGPAGGLTPAQLASAYEYDPAEGGSGQTVAVVDSYDDPNIEKDLGTFDTNYGLPACTTANGCFKKVGETGSTTALPKADTSGWSVEITLDVETVRAVCRNCKIVLVETEGSNTTEHATGVEAAIRLGSTEISNSYGGAEGEYEKENVYNHPGTVITASAGDDGYYSWDEVNKKKPPTLPERPNYPSSLPTVVAVGGTSLHLNENGTRASESVWDHNGPDDELGLKNKAAEGASGGGCSTIFTAEPWQQNVPGFASAGCGTKRLDNDIAAVGDPYTGFDIYDSYNCGESCEENGGGEGWETWGGTSLSSPIVAAMYGLAGGSGGVSYPAATLYSHLGPTSFFDVTEGGNGYCDGEPESKCGKPNSTYKEQVDCEGTSACDARTGFDGPTGVGTPKGLSGFKSNALTLLEQTSATLNARVNPDGSNVTECKFEYGTTTGYGHSAECKSLPGSGTSPVAVSTKIAGLSPNTEYHFRVVTKSAAGTVDGPDIAFRTLSVAAPSVETKGSGSVGASSATLYASVNPRGGSVSTCKFEYGTSTGYGSSVSCASLPGGGSSPVVVDASISSGLAANTTYHYRVSATNSGGTSKGTDATFKTS